MRDDRIATIVRPSVELLRREDAERVHCKDFVDRVWQGKLTAQEVRRIGLGMEWNHHVMERVLRVSGCTVAAARLMAWQRKQLGEKTCAASVIGGGAHHSHWDHGAGYCVFNDLAIAAHVLAHQEKLRVLILDLDVHQGDGTAAIFKKIPHNGHIFTVSLHAASNFPLHKQISDIDVELPDRMQDKEYLEELRVALGRIDHCFPDFDVCLYQGGVDVLATDRLGRLALSESGLRQRDEMAFNFCLKHNASLVCTSGGGYFHDEESLQCVVRAHAEQTIVLHQVYGGSGKEGRTRRGIALHF